MNYSRYVRLCFSALLVIAALPLISGCIDIQSNQISPEASGLISQAVMATSINSTTLEPVKTTDRYKTDTPVIYCSVLLLEAPDDTVVNADWIYVKGEVPGENQRIGDSHIVTDGPRFLSFEKVRTEEKWMRGDYNVVISVNGKKEITVPFKIQ